MRPRAFGSEGVVVLVRTAATAEAPSPNRSGSFFATAAGVVGDISVGDGGWSSFSCRLAT
jgi:hypothetical protein